VEHLIVALLGQALTLLANIRLDWKGLPRTNTLAYYKNSQIIAVKCFIGLAPGSQIRSQIIVRDKPGNTKGGSIPVPLTSCLTGLD
jgi:hypothetical protein